VLPTNCLKPFPKNEYSGFERQYLDLVALGTVADVVPLLGENRIIVKYGLPMIEKTSNVGLRSLIKVAGDTREEMAKVLAMRT